MQSIFVTGATGNQGGATAKDLAKNGVKVKALTRNPSSSKADELRKLDIEVVEGDLNDPDSYQKYLDDVDGVFAVLPFPNIFEKEIMQGKQLADAAKEKGIKHFIYSSVGFSDQKTGIPHFESKYLVEKHIQRIGIPYTILRPVSFYENFLVPQVRDRIWKGKFIAPMDRNVVQQIISAKDVGNVASHIFRHRDQFLNRTLSLASEQMDQSEMAAAFSQVLGKEIKFQRLPGLIVRLAMGKDLHTMFKYVNSHGGVFAEDFKTINAELPPMQTLSDWISINFKK